MVDVLVVFVLY